MRNIYFWLTFGAIILCLGLSCNSSTPSKEQASPNAKTDTSTNTSHIQKELDQLEAKRGNMNRTIWQQPRMIIQKLGDLSQKTIADIGAGPFGYFSFQLVNEAKKVIAIDIDQNALNIMDSLRLDILSTKKQAALEMRLATPDNPKLKTAEADVIILMNIYAYLPNQSNYLSTLKKGLSKDGQILIVDYKMRQLPIGPPQQEKIPLFIVENDLIEAGFKISLVDDRTLDYQYMVIATK